MYLTRLFTIGAVFFAVQVGTCEDTGAAPRHSEQTAPNVSDTTGQSETTDFLRSPKLRRLWWAYGQLTQEERAQLKSELRKPEVKEEIRRILDNPERWEGIRRERPKLYDVFREQRRREKQYWELLKKYHESADETERTGLKKTVQDELVKLVDAETVRYQGELERLSQQIERLRKHLKVRLDQHDEIILRRLEKDLTTLPPPPSSDSGPDEHERGRGPRGPHDSESEEDRPEQHRGTPQKE
ncbi:MAG: hypothetical protein ABIH23_24775 [bacterium]